MIVALSRFGSFSGLAPIRSADKDGAPYQDSIPFIDYGNKYLSVGASYD